MARDERMSWTRFYAVCLRAAAVEGGEGLVLSYRRWKGGMAGAGSERRKRWRM